MSVPDSELRGEALQHAVRICGEHATPDRVLKAAEQFYAFLKGDAPASNLTGLTRVADPGGCVTMSVLNGSDGAVGVNYGDV